MNSKSKKINGVQIWTESNLSTGLPEIDLVRGENEFRSRRLFSGEKPKSTAPPVIFSSDVSVARLETYDALPYAPPVVKGEILSRLLEEGDDIALWAAEVRCSDGISRSFQVVLPLIVRPCADLEKSDTYFVKEFGRFFSVSKLKVKEKCMGIHNIVAERNGYLIYISENLARDINNVSRGAVEFKKADGYGCK